MLDLNMKPPLSRLLHLTLSIPCKLSNVKLIRGGAKFIKLFRPKKLSQKLFGLKKLWKKLFAKAFFAPPLMLNIKG